jgi:hypothetical protein
MAERDGPGQKMALMALGGWHLRDITRTQFSRSLARGLLARMMNDDAQSHAAFGVFAGRRKIVQAQPDTVCGLHLALIDAGLGPKKISAAGGQQRAVQLVR